ncbi:hypothetical protein FNF27_07525 [Cafeteria roenbergensis]|nr:hypothetical protein FNF29_02782 [Cafeteria roenbergensis]KAA0166363.1 hypothetical protein FNF27_07525 [Cafeteria roenbergensis]KAA0166894.1 hypothetical protein FNF31_01269 [Cafeteria roenbergensis]|eukprot:KAA0154162.1 hypothetical protein FNF29_02782 [Cafeteria roenbergensis]
MRSALVASPVLGTAAPWPGARVGSRALFISAESTPNPDSLKFCPSDVVILQEDQGTGIFFNSLPKARGSSMVSELLRLPHVTGVFLGRDFVTVNKHEDAQWEDIKPLVMSAIMSGLTSSEPVLQGSYHVDDASAYGDDDDEVVAMIRELIEMRVRPAVQEDGGDIFFVAFDHETGIVRLKMAGSCVGCPSSTATLRGGVENMLRHYVPEVEGIEQVVEDGEGGHKPMDDEDAPAESLEERLAAAGVPGYAR